MDEDIYSLIKKENWNLIVNEEGIEKIEAYGELYRMTHPVNIHLKLYREVINPVRKFKHMKAAHDYLWPDELWHYWTQRKFEKHCEDWSYITYAGGASAAKSNDTAKLALLFWLANPAKRGVIIASTTLESLNSRIWGYVKKYLRRIAIPLPVKYTASPTPKILYTGGDNVGIKNLVDTIHGMFAIAAKKGEDDDAIASWIGRHPEEGMLLVLDEATDMPLSILKALPNLEAKAENFQCIAIGNSNSKSDLHGTLSTPKAGWDSINPFKDIMWETTQKNGICLFFSCYESPAIHEDDPILRQCLSQFLITAEEIEAKEAEFGRESDSFMRFVLGYWKKTSSSGVVIDPDFIDRYHVQDLAEWSGVYDLTMVAGLDPSFSSGGDQCVLRLAILGVDVRGKMVLDFRGDKLLFRIPLTASITKSPELQVADGVIDVLSHYGVRLPNLCIDANGGGRGLGETIRLRMNARFGTEDTGLPRRVITTRLGTGNIRDVKDPGIIIISAYDLWWTFRPYMEHEQIRGLDSATVMQLTSRKVDFDKQLKPRLETKLAFKQRVGAMFRNQAKSPDEADASAHTLQMAIVGHGFYPGQEVKLENPFMVEKMYHMHKAIMTKQDEVVRDVRNLKANFSAGVESLVGSRKLFS